MRVPCQNIIMDRATIITGNHEILVRNETGLIDPIFLLRINIAMVITANEKIEAIQTILELMTKIINNVAIPTI